MPFPDWPKFSLVAIISYKGGWDVFFFFSFLSWAAVGPAYDQSFCNIEVWTGF